MLAQVKPGEIRAALPDHAPDEPEPFADVLRDLDEILLPGVTHWQHPRYFAYFATSASEAGILAELLTATLNSVSFLWRTAPAATELEWVVLEWLAKLLGLPDGLARPHRGHRVDVDVRGDDRRPRGDRAQPRRLLRAHSLGRPEGRPDARYAPARGVRPTTSFGSASTRSAT